jgi:hypothetical protein
MHQHQHIARALSAIGVATLLAACSSNGSPGGNSIPSGIAATSPANIQTSRPVPTKKHSGWGVSVEEVLNVLDAGNPYGCSGPPSACNEWVPKKSLNRAVTTSSYYGSASLKTTTALGTLSGSGKAVQTGHADQSTVAYTYTAWEDVFTITSGSLSSGSPVSFTATITVTGPAIQCSATQYESVGFSTSYSGLSFQELCGSSPTPVLTATVNTTVGATFNESALFGLYLQAGAPYTGGKINSGTYKAVYHLDPITSGATYSTASGKQYP